MPYCQNCGRPLGENEVCNCTAQAPNQNPNMQSPNPAYNYGYNYNLLQPPKKKGFPVFVIIILALLIPVLIIIVSMAAILIPSLIGFSAKSKAAAINGTAKSIYHSCEYALADMGEDGYDVKGDERYYVLSSDPDWNRYVPFEMDTYYEYAEDYMYFIDEYTYFVVVRDGKPEYVVCEEKGGSYVGTYPNRTNPNEPPAYSGDNGTKKWDVEDIYEYNRGIGFEN